MSATLRHNRAIPAFFTADTGCMDCARCGEVLSAPHWDCSFCTSPGAKQPRFPLLGPVLIALGTFLLLHLIAVMPAAYWGGDVLH